MNETTSTSPGATQPTHDEISQKARELWENYGRPAGRDEEIWFEAERALQGPANTPAAESSTKDITPPPPRAASSRSAGGATATPRMPGARTKRSA